MKRIIVILYLFVSCLNSLYSQKKVEFYTKDKLLVTADLYQKDKSLPYIVLFHQAGYSRGEYIETAKKLTNLGYNCLAVDLRSGKEVNFVQNETAKRAMEKGLSSDYMSAIPDMEAAINYAFQQNKKRVIVFGSSYSASLSLYLATYNHKIKAVIAYSPGEYFKNKLKVKEELAKIRKPVYIATSKREEVYAKDVAELIPKKMKTVFIPTKGSGIHGSRSLWKDCDAYDEYWLSLTMFFIKIKDLK